MDTLKHQSGPNAQWADAEQVIELEEFKLSLVGGGCGEVVWH